MSVINSNEHIALNYWWKKATYNQSLLDVATKLIITNRSDHASDVAVAQELRKQAGLPEIKVKHVIEQKTTHGQ